MLRVAMAFAALSLVGCSTFPSTVTCDRDTQCTRGATAGQCVSGGCAFAAPECPSRMRYDDTSPVMAGACVPDAPPGVDGGLPRVDAQVDGGGSSETNLCGGTAPLPGDPGDPCGLCMRGTYVCDGENSLRCEGEPTIEENVTAMGFVSASSTFGGNDYPPPLAVDGNLQTSWFSAGPEGMPTRYEWAAPSSLCITRVTIIGNGRHSNSSFRNDFGFGDVTAQVLDDGATVTASMAASLPGTPDPDTELTLEGEGTTVRLLFSGHESDDCGGFSELSVFAIR